MRKNDFLELLIRIFPAKEPISRKFVVDEDEHIPPHRQKEILNIFRKSEPSLRVPPGWKTIVLK